LYKIEQQGEAFRKSVFRAEPAMQGACIAQDVVGGDKGGSSEPVIEQGEQYVVSVNCQ
jgi:hypothetical protein